MYPLTFDEAECVMHKYLKILKTKEVGISPNREHPNKFVVHVIDPTMENLDDYCIRNKVKYDISDCINL